jgi:ABC-type polysaccharide/polyol phosphate transport system ATPase subunit
LARIHLENVDLEFHVGAEREDTLNSVLAHGFGLRRRRRESRTVKALQSVSLSISAGERVGLIGHNGAGKSTLLKVMAGIYPPQRGRVAIEGHVCPLFEFVTGFEMEATGWENIRTRALLLGMMPKEIDRKIESIAKFSNLGEFLDIPVRHYSSGMYVRLAFATSTAVDPQILLLDEVMAAGDVEFIERARERMNDLMERASLVVFATHSLDVLPRFCERTILLRQGRVVADGPTDDVVRLYTEGRSITERTLANTAHGG